VLQLPTISQGAPCGTIHGCRWKVWPGPLNASAALRLASHCNFWQLRRSETTGTGILGLQTQQRARGLSLSRCNVAYRYRYRPLQPTSVAGLDILLGRVRPGQGAGPFETTGTGYQHRVMKTRRFLPRHRWCRFNSLVLAFSRRRCRKPVSNHLLIPKCAPHIYIYIYMRPGWMSRSCPLPKYVPDRCQYFTSAMEHAAFASLFLRLGPRLGPRGSREALWTY